MRLESREHPPKGSVIDRKTVVLTYEILMAVLAIFSVVTIWSTSDWLHSLDFIVWFIFFIDVLVRFIISKDRLQYLKSHPLDIIAVIPLDSIFRLARLGRLFRLIRAFAILSHYFKPFYAVLKTNNLDKVIIALFVLIFVTSIPIRILEPSIYTYTDAVWWAIVTSTTVGYGDISPETIVGRIIAVILMMFGIALLGLVTSSIATYFLNNKNNKENPTIEYIKGELDRVEELTDKEIERLQILLDTYKKQGYKPR
ncbi:potassium channel family protein [Desertibacillus haloalkaliphilus]|uniref:potassium channel family protein n=1 Tax=Desertibacillus haloalkaliphilus TaxID=1328930 RepID=UPI001C25AD5D|nr:potassium channel family protein [Desertibacillus haloalkaliphilus]MBU8907630.1 potassium channel family protein [Desertibacillus haloalkaliphilus]